MKKSYLVLIIVLIIVLIAVGIYFVFFPRFSPDAGTGEDYPCRCPSGGKIITNNCPASTSSQGVCIYNYDCVIRFTVSDSAEVSLIQTQLGGRTTLSGGMYGCGFLWLNNCQDFKVFCV